MFLVNAYDLTIDPKNRLSIPNAIRSKMNEETDGRSFYVVPGERKTILNLFAERYYEIIRKKRPPIETLKPDARAFARWEASMTALVEPDGQGRIVLPDRLLKFAGLGKDVYLVGAIDHLELWARDEYDAFHNQMGSSYESIRERAMTEFAGGVATEG